MRIVIEGNIHGIRIEKGESTDDFILAAAHELLQDLLNTIVLKNYQQQNMIEAKHYG